MEQDLEMLQSISDTLKTEPQANQRTLAQNAGMSIGLMNAVLKRFVERGWIMLTNVNGRKLAYAVTVDGIKELTERGKRFASRTFKIANTYNEVLVKKISEAKEAGKQKVVLYGDSYIKFMIEYACKENGVSFEQIGADAQVDSGALCLAGEMCGEEVQSKLVEAGCVSLVEILNCYNL